MRVKRTATGSRFGPQPFLDALREDGRTPAGTARHLGFDAGYLRRVGYGRVAPCEEFRAAISELLGVEREALFTADALAARYVERRNAAVFAAGHNDG